MGLTDSGFVRRTYDEILNDKIQRAKELFGEDIDTSDLTPLGKYLRINAYDQAIAEEEIEAVYYARFPNTASGQSLDRLLVFGGISRNPATAATFAVNVQGTAGYVIPAGFLAGTDTDLTYYTTAEATIGDDGTCTVIMECTEAGIGGNVNASAINKVVNPDANISAVDGIECLSFGAEEESDAALRERLKTALAGSGGSNENAIRAALLRVPTVQYAAVVVNETDSEDSDGRPAHSFECYVLGGDDYHREIAEAIFSTRPVGIQTVGDIAVTVIDASGNERAVNFSAAPNVQVVVYVKYDKNTNFPNDGAAQIQRNITNRINALSIGNPLILSSMYGDVYSVPGITEVTELAISTDGGNSYTHDNVTVPSYGVISCENVYVGTSDGVILCITLHPVDRAVTVGETAIFTAEATGDGLTYQWQAKPATASGWNDSSGNDESGKTASLSLTAKAWHDGYMFRCKITDANGAIAYTKIAVLTVNSTEEVSAE